MPQNNNLGVAFCQYYFALKNYKQRLQVDNSFEEFSYEKATTKMLMK